MTSGHTGKGYFHMLQCISTYPAVSYSALGPKTQQWRKALGQRSLVTSAQVLVSRGSQQGNIATQPNECGIALHGRRCGRKHEFSQRGGQGFDNHHKTKRWHQLAAVMPHLWGDCSRPAGPKRNGKVLTAQNTRMEEVNSVQVVTANIWIPCWWHLGGIPGYLKSLDRESRPGQPYNLVTHHGQGTVSKVGLAHRKGILMGTSPFSSPRPSL